MNECNKLWLKTLFKDGIAKLPNFDNNFLPNFTSKFDKNDLEILLEYHGKKNNNFEFLVRDRTYINIDKNISGSDYGFIELLNPDELPENSKYFINSDFIKSYLRGIGINFKPNYISYYIYDNINLPRRLHHDTSFDSFKIFIALTNITDITCGPYVFVKRSHKDYLYKISDLISSSKIRRTGGDGYDAAWIKWDNIIYPYLNRGEVIITNQKGIHGDLPASKGKSKNLLAICFNQKDIKSIFNDLLYKR